MAAAGDGGGAGEPAPIALGVAVFDIAFHPQQDVLAAGLVDGGVHLYGYSPDGNKRLLKLQLHADSVRSTRFAGDGSALVTGSADRSVALVDARGGVAWRRDEAHKAPVNVVAPFAGSLVASGDDDGAVRIWDARAAPGTAPVAFSAHSDVVTALHVDEGRATLLSTSGDGTLCAYDLRKGKLSARSEEDEEELLSIAVAKGGATIVTGTQDGVLLLWNWGKLAYREADPDTVPERFTGHPESIDALLAVDDDTVVTGSSDGLLRLVTLRPNKLVGVIGEHGDDPVERLAWSRDRRLLASTSHDETVRFWDTGYLYDEDLDEGTEEEGAAAAAAAGAGAGAGGTGAGGVRQSRFTELPALALPRAGISSADYEDEDDEDEDEEGGGMEEDDEDMGDEDDDSDGGAAGGGGGKKPKQGGKKKGNTVSRSGKKGGGGKKGGAGGGFYGGLL